MRRSWPLVVASTWLLVSACGNEIPFTKVPKGPGPGTALEPPLDLIVLEPSTGLRVELSWNADITDVDLHLIEAGPSAQFFEEPSDCFFGNQNPDWGESGESEDDPLLPVDVDDGFGPERITLARPAIGVYRILSHYYCDDGFGATTATVKVFSDGDLQAELDATLQRTGDLWEVASVVYDSAGFVSLVVSTSGVGSSSRGCE